MSLFHATFLLYAWFELLINPNICFINEKTKKKKKEREESAIRIKSPLHNEMENKSLV